MVNDAIPMHWVANDAGVSNLPISCSINCWGNGLHRLSLCLSEASPLSLTKNPASRLWWIKSKKYIQLPLSVRLNGENYCVREWDATRLQRELTVYAIG